MSFDIFSDFCFFSQILSYFSMLIQYKIKDQQQQQLQKTEFKNAIYGSGYITSKNLKMNTHFMHHL